MIKKYLLFATILLLAGVILAGDRAGEEINWQVVSGGGAINGNSNSFILSSVVSQTAAGYGNSDSFKLYHGFLQNFTQGPAFLCGDVNDDGVVNILDILYYIDWKFSDPAGPPPVDMATADVNADTAYNILDILYLIDYKFGTPAGPDPNCP